MSEEMTVAAEDQARLARIARHLHHAMDLRAALAPFQITLHQLEEQGQEPDGRRQILTLWRPCQERLDRLLEVAQPQPDWVHQLRLLRQEMEDNLLDQAYSPLALIDLTDAFDEACEILLLRLDHDLDRAVTSMSRAKRQRSNDESGV